LDVYDAIEDPYCYPGTTVLKNIPNLRDKAALERFEAALSKQRADEPLPIGRLGAAQYRAIHRHLFQDVYKWAGRYRTVRMSKDGNPFCYPENIDQEMRKIFEWLKNKRYLRGLAPERFAPSVAQFLSELNAIHPFREGNGRTQTTFLVVLAEQSGHPLDLTKLEAKKFLRAMIESFGGDNRALESQVLAMMKM
jgi:cell filamentation protein